MDSPPGIFNLRSSFCQLCLMLSAAQDVSPAIAGMVEFIDSSYPQLRNSSVA